MNSTNSSPLTNKSSATTANLTCTMCNKHFRWKSGLSRHIKLFHLQNKEKRYKCELCDKLFYKQVGLSMHMKRHINFKSQLSSDQVHNHMTTDKPLLKTNESQSTIEESIAQKVSKLYANVITETVYSSDSDCEYEIIQTATKLNNSAQKHDHKCQFCEKSFVKLSSLEMHLKKHVECHKEKTSSSDVQCDKDTNENQTAYSCNKCIKTFKLSRSLTSHLKIHLQQSIVARKELAPSNFLKLKPRYKCAFCTKFYFKQIHLNNHLATHNKNQEETNEKQRRPECKEELQGNKLEVRMKTHTCTKPFLCVVCGKGYSRSGYLSVHMRTHSNYRPHLCSVCGKSFTIRRYLIVHSRTHNQERPFRCQHCSKGFIQKGNLVEHLRIHTGIKPHVCSICGKRFTHYSGLTQHLLTHSSVKNHVCKICGKAFRQGGHYREHMRIHSGDRPFVCNICSRRFASSSSLVVHTRTHSGERPFRCSTCKKGFIKSYGLKQHKKTHASCNT